MNCFLLQNRACDSAELDTKVELEDMKMPEWLKNLNPVMPPLKVPMSELLEDSFYYPGSGLDGMPLRIFSGKIHSFVYVDYALTRERLICDIHGDRFHRVSGYHILYERELFLRDIHPVPGRPLTIPPELSAAAKAHQNRLNAFAHWIVYERNGLADVRQKRAERFSLLVISGEMSAVYHGTYGHYNVLPKVLGLINPGGPAEGGGWESPETEDSFFYRTVSAHRKGLPDYLYCTTRQTSYPPSPSWSAYRHPVTLTPTGIGDLWKKMNSTENDRLNL
jgi:hypothetical protein